MSVGIIGYGSFGRLLTSMLSGKADLYVYDKNHEGIDDPDIKKVDMDEIVKCDFIILAVNLDALEKLCGELAGKVSKDTIVIEVCSSKIKPVEILKRNLSGKCQYLATHPLFGPQSAGEKNTKKIVVCESEVTSKDKIFGFLRQGLNLQIVEMSAEKHDRQMAWVHCLTFFVGRGLMELDLSEFDLKTDYYQKLLDLVELEEHHSIELFNTVQKGNPYSQEVREEFVNKLQDINRKLDGENI